MFYLLTVLTTENDGRYEELLLTGSVADRVNWGWMEFCENDEAYRQNAPYERMPSRLHNNWFESILLSMTSIR